MTIRVIPRRQTGHMSLVESRNTIRLTPFALTCLGAVLPLRCWLGAGRLALAERCRLYNIAPKSKLCTISLFRRDGNLILAQRWAITPSAQAGSPSCRLKGAA